MYHQHHIIELRLRIQMLPQVILNRSGRDQPVKRKRQINGLGQQRFELGPAGRSLAGLQASGTGGSQGGPTFTPNVGTKQMYQVAFSRS